MLGSGDPQNPCAVHGSLFEEDRPPTPLTQKPQAFLLLSFPLIHGGRDGSVPQRYQTRKKSAA
jgi:hypothetical protein